MASCSAASAELLADSACAVGPGSRRAAAVANADAGVAANPSLEPPLRLVVDDAHWVDEPSHLA